MDPNANTDVIREIFRAVEERDPRALELWQCDVEKRQCAS